MTPTRLRFRSWIVVVAGMGALALWGCPGSGITPPATLSVDDVPKDAEPITTFNGEWLSRQFSFAFRITDHVGISTLPSSSATTIGDVVLVITDAKDNTFRGRQIFSDGSIQNVVGTLVNPMALSMVGGGTSWTMDRISTLNIPPVVSAGDPQTITPDPGEALLAGAADDDGQPDGELTTTWSQLSGPDGVAFDDASSLETTATFPTAGTYELQLEAFDGELTATATVTITVNTPPVAEAGDDLFPLAGAQVALDGSGSRDVDPGDELAFAWVQVDGSEGAALEGADTATPTFTAPEPPATLVFELTVTDTRGGVSTDRVTVTVNQPPTADAGPDRDVGVGLEVSLDGSASSDPDPDDALSFRWVQTSEPKVTLTGAAGVRPALTAPDAPATLEFELTVTDGRGGSDQDTVTITVTDEVNSPPTANAGRDRNAVVGLVVTLDASGSDDPNANDGLSYAWLQTDGPDAVLDDPRAVRATFTVPVGAERLAFEVTVDDDRGGVDRATVTLTVLTAPRVRLTTSMGDIVVDVLLGDAPVTALNFLQYVEDGFYDGTIFHRVEPGFVIQGGGFLPGMIKQEGLRDPIVNEFDPGRSNLRGTVAMAKLGDDPDSATSQFFFNLVDNSEKLDGQNGGFTVFANVVEGQDVVDAIAAVALKPAPDDAVPVEDVLLTAATIE